MIGQILSAAQAHPVLAQPGAPRGLRITGILDFSERSQRQPPPELPRDLTVDVLDLSGRAIAALPAGLKCYELLLARTRLRALPDDVQVQSRLDLTDCDRLESLPRGLTTGTLQLRGCSALRELPEGLDVWFLDVTGCWALESWPRQAQIRGGRLVLRGCVALKELPVYIRKLAALDVRECVNLRTLPKDLQISGWLDLAGSGLTDEDALPPILDRTQLRWARVNIDRRIAFHPESLQVSEILEERNSERRRVLLDRYGYGRFLRDVDAEVYDEDRDAGGPRQLLCVALTGDEDLVALSCFCPSTSRHYIIRVPPETRTCHQAAAWIAGFDDPNDYRPIFET